MFKQLQLLLKQKYLFDYLFYTGFIFFTIIALVSGKFIYKPFGDRDLPSYLFEWESLAYVLSQHRTIGLPFFLQIFISNNISFKLWPYFQYSCMALSILYLHYSFKIVFKNKFLIFILSILFLLMAYSQRYAVVVSEPLAFAALNFSFGAFLLAIKRSKKVDLAALLIATFFAYQIRPAFIVLPIAFLLCSFYLFFIKDINRNILASISILLIAPLVLFFSLRFFVVGQFGLVAFTGPHLAGHAVMYLDQDTINSLPENNKDFAGKLLESKTKLDPSSTEGYDCRALEKFNITSYSSILLRYKSELSCWNFLNMTAWVIAINDIKKTWPLENASQNLDPWNHVYTLASYFSGDNVKVDKYLVNQSVEILKIKYKSYFSWIFSAFFISPIAYLLSGSRFYLSCILVGFLTILGYLEKKKNLKFILEIDVNDRNILNNVFFVFSLVFLTLSLLPLILLTVPLARYLTAAFYFFYPAFVLCTFLRLYKYNVNDQKNEF